MSHLREETASPNLRITYETCAVKRTSAQVTLQKSCIYPACAASTLGSIPYLKWTVFEFKMDHFLFLKHFLQKNKDLYGEEGKREPMIVIFFRVHCPIRGTR
ncbi:hypothetical protein Ddye_015473 [Dipteronia dyeriana]|uniref:Uncharacterized protein n=1 Tax=Dipteronia dyeriana TaxID=168575 RepID=A0AAD9WXX7_9ROSI|nr:hypothetical protein Ddye_015473 [Dipteronia dyeriana]